MSFTSKGLEIPTLSITSGKDCLTTIEPPLLTDAKGRSLVRKLSVDFPLDGPAVVTAELLPTEVLLVADSPRLKLSIGEQGVAEIVLKDGTRLCFP